MNEGADPDQPMDPHAGMHAETELLHADADLRTDSALVPPIHYSATFVASDAAAFADMAGRSRHPRYYTRYGNPLHERIGRILARLEGTETALVTGSALTKTTPDALRDLSFINLFFLHALLIIFLVGWWLATGMPDLREFLNIRHEKPAEVAAIGLSVGVGGWIITIVMAMLVALLLQATGALKEAPEPPAMVS